VKTIIAENSSKNQQINIQTCPPRDSACEKDPLTPMIAKISDLSLTCVRKQ